MQKAIVVGAGFAGLFTSIVLKRLGFDVVVLEKWELPDQPGHRRGTPQDDYLHAVSAGGYKDLYHLLPGIEAELNALGAPLVHWTVDPKTGIREAKAIFSSLDAEVFVGDLGFVNRNVTRRQLEFLVRQHAWKEGVKIYSNIEVVSLRWREDRVVGVNTIISSNGSDNEVAYSADIVVDASGRTSKLRSWLEPWAKRNGFELPNTLHVDSQLRYINTEWAAMPNNPYLTMGVFESVTHPYGGGIMRMEDRFQTIGFRMGEGPTPGTHQEFREFFRLVHPELYELTEGAEPFPNSIVHVMKGKMCQTIWTPYWLMPRSPRGFHYLGDAVQADNPRFGQGTSKALRDAIRLGQVISEGGDQMDFLHASLKYWDFARELATSSDFKFAGTKTNGSYPNWFQRTQTQMLGRLENVATWDQKTAAFLLQAMHDLKDPSEMMSPELGLSFAKSFVPR
jgi:flavin-dependent dehydrogenase